jgi:hypothetical protein
LAAHGTSLVQTDQCEGPLLRSDMRVVQNYVVPPLGGKGRPKYDQKPLSQLGRPEVLKRSTKCRTQTSAVLKGIRVISPNVPSCGPNPGRIFLSVPTCAASQVEARA